MKAPRILWLTAIVVTTSLVASARQDAAQSNQQEQIEQTPARGSGGGAGTYIVRMNADPVVKYRGTDPRFRATAPARGQKLDPNDPAVMNYASYLDGTHDEALRAVGGGRKLYDYRYAVNGFTAVLTPGQAAQLAATPGVASVEADVAVPLDTATSPKFLGLDAAGGLWEQLGGVNSAGENVIIGIVDGGVWPEHPSFSDRTGANKTGVGQKLAYQQIPGWHGKCTPGEAFNASHCNQKLIGAQFFAEGRLANLAMPDYEYLSPRDFGGHGTHTASTAGGNSGVRVLASSMVMSGMAPRARIAAYKVCFDDGAGTGTCFNSDSVAAIDQAVIDGVDVINFSIGGTTTFFTNVVEVAFFNAAEAGVFVAASAGNSGPTAGTVAHPSPWITTVAATTQPPRSGTTTLTLGNGATYTSASLAAATPALPMVLSSTVGLPNGNDPATPFDEVALCFIGALDPAKVAGRMVVCDRGVNGRIEKSMAVGLAGGLGMVLVNVAPGTVDPDYHSVPTIHVNHVDGAAIKTYAATTGAMGKIAAAAITIPSAPTTVATIAGFSSRGPVAAAGGDLLKPDISAPGVAVLAGVAPPGNGGALFAEYQGTSMSSPHIAGLAALFKQLHPDWSPMAIKSALMTTATQLAGTNAAPFNTGAGFVNPNAAMNPGLVYDSTPAEWLAFVCGTGQILLASCTAAGITPINPTDLNTPSIAVSRATESLPYTVTRRVKNVGPASTYAATVTTIPGFTAVVSPSTLSLAHGEEKSFTVTFTRTGTTAAFDAYQFGALTWSDGSRNVRTPIAVRPVQLITTGAIVGNAASGTFAFNSFAGYTGPYTVVPHGLVADTRTPGTVQDDPNNSFDTTPATLFTQPGVAFHDITVSEEKRPSASMTSCVRPSAK